MVKMQVETERVLKTKNNAMMPHVQYSFLHAYQQLGRSVDHQISSV
jgi:hypothetical protein